MASKTKSLSPANTGPTGEQAQIFLKRQRELIRQFEQRPEQILAGMQNLIGEKKQIPIISTASFLWEKFYQEIFGFVINFSNVSIPDHPDDYKWQICMPSRSVLGDEMALSGGKHQYKINYRYTDDKNMNLVINHQFDWSRDSWDKPYIIFVRPNIEADKDMKGISAWEIRKQCINTITFRERIILQRFLLWKANLILDKNTVTLCADSRYIFESVPTLNWQDDGVVVDYYSCDNSIGSVYARRVAA